MPYTDDQIKAMIEQTAIAVMSRQEAQHERIEEQLQKHEHLLYGNGREGIVTKLDRIERAVTQWTSMERKAIEFFFIALVVGGVILLVQANLLIP